MLVFCRACQRVAAQETLSAQVASFFLPLLPAVDLNDVVAGRLSLSLRALHSAAVRLAHF